MNHKINDIILSVENLSVSIQNKPLFSRLSFALKANETCVIYGKSGCGKSTFLQTLLGFVSGFQGKIIYRNNLPLTPGTIPLVRQLTAWVPQETAFDFASAKEALMTPFTFKLNKSKIPENSKITHILQQLNLPEDILTQPFNALSGGEKQRLLLASCLLLEKPLLMLDEPTSALDSHNKSAVIQLLKNYPFACLIISHDEELIQAFDHKLCFENFTV